MSWLTNQVDKKTPTSILSVRRTRYRVCSPFWKWVQNGTFGNRLILLSNVIMTSKLRQNSRWTSLEMVWPMFVITLFPIGYMSIHWRKEWRYCSLCKPSRMLARIGFPKRFHVFFTRFEKQLKSICLQGSLYKVSPWNNLKISQSFRRIFGL